MVSAEKATWGQWISTVPVTSQESPGAGTAALHNRASSRQKHPNSQHTMLHVSTAATVTRPFWEPGITQGPNITSEENLAFPWDGDNRAQANCQRSCPIRGHTPAFGERPKLSCRSFPELCFMPPKPQRQGQNPGCSTISYKVMQMLRLILPGMCAGE